MSFAQYLESKKRNILDVSYDHYREELERSVYDTLLDPVERIECVLAHLSEVGDLRTNLLKVDYPKRDELLMTVASREPAKIRRAHEQFSLWGKKQNFDEISAIDNALFECRSYLYGTEIPFSKEMANRFVESAYRETEKNIVRLAVLIEKAIGRISNWHGSTVILKVLKPDDSWISNEGMVIVGQPPSMTFMCRNPNKLEIYDIQDIDGYPLSIQEDYANLIRLLQVPKSTSVYQTWYFLGRQKDRPIYERIKRDLSLGIDATLPSSVQLLEEVSDGDLNMDVWRVKVKGEVITEVNEANIRWLDLYRKAIS